jgi:hypothetical protein
MTAARRTLFPAGIRLRVRGAFGSGVHSQFVAGELLTFVACRYSPYDECSVYEFRNAQGESKEWWLGDEESPAVWTSLFEEV